MAFLTKHNMTLGRQIEQASHSAKTMCWTCGSCDFECPVNIATGRLRPQKIVRMANLGMLDELLHLPEIWYCLTCRRCMNVCPNAVSPAMLIEFVRRDILVRGMVSMDTMRLYQDLFTKFQRVRWHAVKHCFKEELDFFTDRMWHDWLGTQVWSGRLMWVSSAMSKFDEEGTLTDDGVEGQLIKYMSGLTEFVARLKN